MSRYKCGKCGSTALYRDDDRMNGAPCICCKICGNRWPGGIEPKVTNPGDRGTEERENAVSAPGSAVIATPVYRPSNTIVAARQIVDGLLDQHGGPIMEEPKKTKKWIKKCFDCGQDKPHHGRGLCGICYTKHKKAGTLPPPLKLALTTDDNLANPCELKHLAPLSPPSVIPAPNPVIPAEAGIHLAPVILIPNITLSFPPADQPLFDSILAEAKRYRRDPDQQILWIVGEALKCGGLD